MRIYANMYLLSNCPAEYMLKWVGCVCIRPAHSLRTKGTLFDVGIVCSQFKNGEYGFHIHEVGNLAPEKNKKGQFTSGLAAKDHYDPYNTKSHQGPFGKGHVDDLPRLHFNKNGVCLQTVAANRVVPADIIGRSLIIHGGYDNYSDTPEVNGGSGGRVLGGVIKAEND